MDRLRRLFERAQREAEARGNVVSIPQPDGPPRRFTAQQAREAFIAMTEGRQHPMLEAAASSSDPTWRGSFFSSAPMEEVEDLSES